MIHLGYFEHFKLGDVLLIEADAAGLGELEQAMRSLAQRAVGVMSIHALTSVEAHQRVELVAETSAQDVGLTWDGSLFRWRRTSEGWRQAADKVSALRQTSPGHQYLDTPRDKFRVVVASGEHGDTWWAKRG